MQTVAAMLCGVAIGLLLHRSAVDPPRPVALFRTSAARQEAGRAPAIPALDRVTSSYAQELAPGRDLFAYGGTATPIPRAGAVAASRTDAEVVPAPPPRAAEATPRAMRVLGVVTTPARRIAIARDDAGTLHVAEEGQTLALRYDLVRVDRGGVIVLDPVTHAARRLDISGR